MLTLLDKNMSPFAITSFALFDEHASLRQGYQKVEFYAYTPGVFRFSWLSVDCANTVPYDCGYKEVSDYLKWEDMKGCRDACP